MPSSASPQSFGRCLEAAARARISTRTRSIDEAAHNLVDERIAERMIEEGDLAWAKPYVDQALAEVERGEVMTLDEHEARMHARLASLPDSRH